jgi:uncharacterized DUF497 family protein
MDDNDELRFCWDKRKAARNIERHGVSFERATYVFDDPMKIEQAAAFTQGEYGSIVIGRVSGKVLTVVYTIAADDLYRIISARFATPFERNDYKQNPFHS